MEITRPQLFNRDQSKALPPVALPKESDVNRFVQWLVYKPQAHAVEPFKTNEPTRNSNTTRK